MAFDPVTLGAAVKLAKDPAAIQESVDAWLDDHPEATTTVEDGSITKAKLDSNLQATVDDVGELKSAIDGEVHYHSSNQPVDVLIGTYINSYGNLSQSNLWVSFAATDLIKVKKGSIISINNSDPGLTYSYTVAGAVYSSDSPSSSTVIPGSILLASAGKTTYTAPADGYLWFGCKSTGSTNLDSTERAAVLNALTFDLIYSRVEDNTKDIAVLKGAIADMNTATSTAIGKALSPKTVSDGKVTEWQFKTIPSGGGGGSGAVDDVQVNGVSVVQDGVANVPIASTALGVVKKRNPDADGIYIDASGYIAVYPGAPTNIKTGTAANRPVGIQNQHYSAFYGLAKAAGSDEKDSTLPVGQYTDAAKSAIQTMLGISGIIAPVEDATASKSYAIGDAFLHGGALYKASAAIAAGDAIVPGTNCAQTTIIEMLKGA